MEVVKSIIAFCRRELDDILFSIERGMTWAEKTAKEKVMYIAGFVVVVIVVFNLIFLIFYFAVSRKGHSSNGNEKILICNRSTNISIVEEGVDSDNL